MNQDHLAQPVDPALSANHWLGYYQAVEGRPPRETLLKALELFELTPELAPKLMPKPTENRTELDHSDHHSSRFAVDLGCGDGRDTVELLRRGWRVLAIDGEQRGLDRLLSRSVPLSDHQLQASLETPLETSLKIPLQTQLMRFEDLKLPPEVDLINASFCLAFCPPAAFPAFWQTIVSSLKSGGRFCGQFFGDRDSWTRYPNRSHHSRADVDRFLEPFEIEWFEEEEHPGVTAIGEEKDWHLFHVVARKLG